MARKRMIHPGIWTDEKFLQLPNDEARLLFVGMMNFANDEGIFKYNIISIKAQVLPMTKTKLGLIEDYVRTMLELRLLEQGHDINDDVKLLRYKNWHTYQKINHATPSKYTFTEYKNDGSLNTNVGLSEDSIRTTSQYNIIKDNIIKDKVIKSKVSVKEKSSKTNKEDFTFNSFYDIYPRKVGKAEALKAYKKIHDKDLKAVFSGLNRYVEKWSKEKTEKDFIPHASTWLNQKRWDDEIDITIEQPKFKDQLDEQISKRSSNAIQQSKQLKRYLDKADEEAIEDVPDLLADFKKNRESSNEKPLSKAIGSFMAQAKANSDSNG